MVKRRLLGYVVVGLLVAAVAVQTAWAGGYDGYKSGYPQLHAVLTHQVPAQAPTPAGRGFDWHDAAIGAAAAAGLIFLLAGAAVVLTRRRTPRAAL